MVKAIKCKLFLEGIEVPFNSITIQERIGQPAQATVVLPVNDKFLQLLPKTQAHVFYSDTGGDPFHLIYEGALSGISFKRMAGQRGVEASFVSHTNEINKSYIKKVPTKLSRNHATNNLLYVGTFDSTYWGSSHAAESVEETMKSGKKSDLTYQGFTISDTITGLTVLTNFLANVGPDSNNTIKQALVAMMEDIVDKNLYYTLLNDTIKLLDRIYISDNELTSNIIKDTMFVESVTHAGYSLPDYIPASGLISMILAYLGYEWVDLSAPTWDPENNVPLSFIFKPRSEYMLPILSNIIMPYEVTSLNYDRNMESEPTRLTISARPVALSRNNAVGVMSNFVSVAPFIAFDVDDKGNPIATPTPEEKRRGFTPHYGEFGSQMEKLLSSRLQAERMDIAEPGEPAFIMQGAVDSDDSDNLKKTNEKIEFYTRFSEKAFHDARYNSRRCNLSTEYNPYRVIGFPALIVDRILPSIYGTIVGIDSRISADGSTSQNLTIDSPKLITKSEPTNLSIYEAFTNFLPEFPAIYDEKEYAADKIGKKMYNDIMGYEEADQDGGGLAFLNPEHGFSHITNSLVGIVNKIIGLLEDETLNKHHLDALRKRNLCTEKQFWDFMNRTNTPEDYYEAETLKYTKTKDKKPEKFANPEKPFVAERRDRVKLAIRKAGEVYV